MAFRFRGPLPALLAAAVSLAAFHSAAAQRLVLSSKKPWGGELISVRVELGESRDSVVDIAGRFAGEPLHFHVGPGSATTFGAVPVDVSDSAIAQVELARASGRIDTLRQVLRFPHREPTVAVVAPRRIRGRKGRRLRVDRKFTTRQDSATVARVEHENELARDIGRDAHLAPQLWTEPFMRPRQSRITSRFGSGRVFNGRVASSHLGVDFRGQVGEPVYAANRGVVALVDSFYLAGNVIYIDHGAGVVTGYFHLSQANVAVGDTVQRGQEIGLVGATGRVTGPHLHWAARYGAVVFDPSEILRVTRSDARVALNHAAGGTPLSGSR